MLMTFTLFQTDIFSQSYYDRKILKNNPELIQNFRQDNPESIRTDDNDTFYNQYSEIVVDRARSSTVSKNRVIHKTKVVSFQDMSTQFYEQNNN
jgi:hypothetical protein